jgi:hypothetical protein
MGRFLLVNNANISSMEYLSMIIRSVLLRAMDSTKLSRKYSIESLLIELEKLHMIVDL